MLDENQMIHPGRPADDGDAALDAALAAADQDMLSAISNGLDLDIGLARVLQDLVGPPAARPDIPAPAHPGEDRRIPDAAVSRTPSSRIHPQGAHAASPARVAVLIREVNASAAAVQDQFQRARQAADITARLERVAEQAAARARTAEAAHRAIQAAQPRRSAPLPRQVTFASGTVVLDGLACYLAARALGGSGDVTLAWTVLFLAVLAGAEAAPGLCWDRGERARRVLAALTGFLVILAGTVLLAATGTGLVPAISGASLLTVITAGFLTIGYRALQAAETPPAWRARRQAGKAHQAARLARAQADRNAAERDHLIDAYLGHLRRLALKTSPTGQQPAVESAARQYLLGELPWVQRPGAMPDLDAGRAAILASDEKADPGALAPSRAGLSVPGGQAAAIIALRASVRVLADALGEACRLRLAVRDRARADALARAVPRPGRASDRASALARAIARDLIRVRDRASLSAHDLDSEAGHAIDLDRAIDLANALALDLDLAHGLGLAHDLAGARDLAAGRARDRAAGLVRCLQEAVDRAEELAARSHRGEVDAAGADLSALELTDISVLEGVVWTDETAWPPGIGDQVRARSREIRAGVYQVCGGSARDPSELVHP